MPKVRSVTLPRQAGTVLLLLAWGCGGTPTSPTPPTTSSGALKVFGPVGTLVPRESAQLQAMKYLNGGETDVTASAVWSTSDASVVMVSAGGLASALAPGNADVTAAVDGLRAAIGIRVVPSDVQLAGQIDAEAAADIIAYNQEAGPLGNSHKGTITRFDLPVRVYVDPSFARFADCPQRAVKSWQLATGLPIVFIDNDVEPRIRMIVRARPDNRGYTSIDSANLDNSFRSVTVLMPTWGPGCDAPVEDAVTHEIGHALGILGHPDWGGVMAYLPYGVWLGVRSPSSREVRFLVELYKLPLGAHLEPDGSWVVR
jgi:hypothetical protein